MRITGSLAFVAAARAAFLITGDKEDNHRRLFLPIKNNLGNDQNGLAFTIESHNLPSGIETSRIKWKDEVVTITADEAMSPQVNHEEQGALHEAMDFLTKLLSDGPLSQKQIKQDADGSGQAWQTVRRAKKLLGVISTKDGMGGPWSWSLPPKMLNSPEDAQVFDMNTFEDNEHLPRLDDLACEC